MYLYKRKQDTQSLNIMQAQNIEITTSSHMFACLLLCFLLRNLSLIGDILITDKGL